MDNVLDLYNAREGTSQRTRLDKDLLPESFEIDGRTTGELVTFAVEFSKSLNYYHPDSTVTQSWKGFFIKERYIFLYIIAETNLYQKQKSFYQSFEHISSLTDQTDIRSQLHFLITPIHEIVDVLAYWNSALGTNEVNSDKLINIFEFINKEHVSREILRVYLLSIYLNLDASWENIRNNFSLDLKQDEFDIEEVIDADILKLLKNIFEEVYRYSENIIRFAKDTLTELKGSHQNVRPHMALFLGFLKVYGILQTKINYITKRHLDYYFQEVLKLSKKGINPDETYVRIELISEFESYSLEMGTSVTGGKDSSGTPIVYQTIHDAELTNVKICGLYTLFVSQNKLNYTGLSDGNMITDIYFRKHDPQNIRSIPIFGEDQFYKAASEKTMEIASAGFIVASDFMLLTEGERQLGIEIIATDESYQSFITLIQQIDKNERNNNDDYDYTFFKIFSTAFEVYVLIDGVETRYERFKVINRPEIKGFSLEIFLGSEDPAITHLENQTIKNQPKLDRPYIKVLLKDESHIYAYPIIQMLDIVNIKLQVEVQGIKNFLLFNNYGQIDQSAPFQLFGAVPDINSYFLLGSPELFSKPLVTLDIHVDWYQLPGNPEGWGGYFADYDEEIQNSDYQVEIEYLNTGAWKKLESKSSFSLFEEETINQVKLRKLSNQTHFNNIKLPVDPSETSDGNDFKPYTLNSRSGYLKLELVNPKFAFGFNSYQKNLTKSIQENTKLEGNEQPKDLNPPYSPIARNIAVNYSFETEALSEKGPKDTIQLYSLGPTGYKKRKLKSADKPVKLLIDHKPEGHLMIGLDKYPSNGVINFFFNPNLSTVDPDNQSVPTPKWQFLTNNIWVDMPANALIIDNTKGFLQSGIISIKIPESITNNNTLINDNLFWIKASVDHNAHIAPEIVGIHTNVIRVKWDGKSDGSHINDFTKQDSITKMLNFDPKIVSVEQLLEPFNGRLDEAQDNYYIRISERLRHKNRAYTNWDYERLLLTRFPEIFKVKCFNAIKYSDNIKEIKKIIEPGGILIAVTPDIGSPLVSNKLRPQFGINFLLKMQKYLQDISTPFLKIKLVNAHYEMIRVICKVKFKGLLNSGYYISKLNQELIDFLTPWTDAADVDEQFGNSQYRSKIMSFVKQKDYVDFVTSFSIVKTNTERGRFNLFDTARKDGDPEVIFPEFPWSILTSVKQHDITAIDINKYQDPVPRAIGNMKLGVDFGIIKKKN